MWWQVTPRTSYQLPLWQSTKVFLGKVIIFRDRHFSSLTQGHIWDRWAKWSFFVTHKQNLPIIYRYHMCLIILCEANPRERPLCLSTIWLSRAEGNGGEKEKVVFLFCQLRYVENEDTQTSCCFCAISAFFAGTKSFTKCQKAKIKTFCCLIRRNWLSKTQLRCFL